MQRKHLFLDLEDTCITPVVNGWFNTQCINVKKIKDFIAEFKPDSVHLFSFALWNEAEKERFKLGTQPMLEKALGISLGLMPMVDVEIKQACCSVLHLSTDYVTFTEMSEFWGKQESFRLYVRFLFRNTANWEHGIEVAFLDDAVVNEIFEFPDIRVKGRILNIDEL